MRVPTLFTSQRAFEAIEGRQNAQARLQTQLGTGLRVNSPGEDPVGAAQAELARSRLARIEQDRRATQLAAGLLTTAEGALGQGVDVLQSVRAALVAAGNGAYSLADRQSLAQELRAAREQLLQLANTEDGAGGHVFAGQGAAGKPLTGGATPAWNAHAGQQAIGDGGRYPASVDGHAAFMALPQGNGTFVTGSAPGNTGTGWIDTGTVADPAQLTGHALRITVAGAPGSLTYSIDDLDAGTTLVAAAPLPADGRIDVHGQRVTVGGAPAAGDRFDIAPSGRQSVFQTLDEAIAALESPLPQTVYLERLDRAQANVDGALDGMILMRSRVGQAQRAVESAQQTGELESLAVSQRRSDLQDLDYAKAISDLQANQTAMDAALQAYATVGRLSLFDLLR